MDLGGNVRRRRGIVTDLTGVVALGVALWLVVGCSSAATTVSPTASSASPSASPSPSASIPKAQAQALGGMLDALDYSAVSWTYEPRGDITQATQRQQGALTLVSVLLKGVSTDGKTITFDAVQTYTGEAAIQQEKLDGVHPVGALYHRNRYKHVQVLPLSPDCTVILPAGAAPDLAASPLVAVTPQMLTAAHAAAVPGWFWMVVGGGRVAGLLQQHYN